MGNVIFGGYQSSRAKTPSRAMQEVLMEAILKARELVFSIILILTKSRNLAKICNGRCKPHWLDKAMVADLTFLEQQGMLFHTIYVPNFVLYPLVKLAAIASRFPVHHHWVYPEYCNT